MEAMVEFEHRGARVQLPRETVVQQWLSQVMPAPKFPKLGEYWPGEGGLYMGAFLDDDGNERHVILAEADAFHLKDVCWGCYGDEIEAKSLWNGKANTEAMAAAGSELAKRVLGMQSDGHALHIPSVMEGKLCFLNGRKHFEKAWYLTSTQCSAYTAYGQTFDGGTQYSFSEYGKARVRLVRSFVL